MTLLCFTFLAAMTILAVHLFLVVTVLAAIFLLLIAIIFYCIFSQNCIFHHNCMLVTIEFFQYFSIAVSSVNPGGRTTQAFLLNLGLYDLL